MQICAYHESLGDSVEWFKGILFQHEYDKVYASKIFQFSTLPSLPKDALIGGTGIDFLTLYHLKLQHFNQVIHFILIAIFILGFR